MLSRKSAATCAIIIIAASAMVILVAALIPFKFESPTIFYKFGFEKFLLRTGKIIGLIAAVLLLCQMISAGRLKVLDRVFSLPALYRFHALSAFAIAGLVLMHPTCMLISEGIYSLPFEARYWPEWAGAALLVLILCQVVCAVWRKRFAIPYHRWARVHRLMGVIVVGFLAVHVLFVSESFDQKGPPRTGFMIALGFWALIWIWIRISSQRRFPFTVEDVSPAGKNAHAITLKPSSNRSFRYSPGQFGFMSIQAAGLSREPHPFTIASSPGRQDEVQFIIRCRGDWTDQVSLVKIKDSAFVQGPFGRYSYELEPPNKEIIMIAGGIGMTPMLSMLRHMSDKMESRTVTLIWSNRSEEYLFFKAELEEIQERLKRFRWIPVFTRGKARHGLFGRLDRTTLKRILEDSHRDAAVFLCGPPPMIQNVRSDLKGLGFKAANIHTELFSFEKG